MAKPIKEVLIIGNGVSRLKHQNFIENWNGEIWGCNSIYIEHQAGSVPRLDRLIGDRQAIVPASEYKKKYKLKYVIYNKFVIDKKKTVPGTVPVPLPPKYIRDSGTTLIALAFIEGYDRIVCIGFDLGGKDIYVKNLHTKNKTTWVNHWRRLAEDFDFDKVEFIGYDHKPFILSNEPVSKYADYYLQGLNHIPEDEDVKMDLEVLLLCKNKKNMTSEQNQFLSEWNGEVWLYDTNNYNDFKNKFITRIIAVNDAQVEEYNIDGASYSIYYPDMGTHNLSCKVFKEFRKGWDWKLLMLIQSLYELYDKVYIIWEDDRELFEKQFLGILNEYGAKEKVEIV